MTKVSYPVIALIVALVGLIFVLILAVVFSNMNSGNAYSPDSPSSVACTKDAKICPDGSAVGRIPPKCEFAKCPGEY